MYVVVCSCTPSGRLKLEDCLNPGVPGSSEPQSCYCTLAQVTEPDPVSGKKKKKKRKLNLTQMWDHTFLSRFSFHYFFSYFCCLNDLFRPFASFRFWRLNVYMFSPSLTSLFEIVYILLNDWRSKVFEYRFICFQNFDHLFKNIHLNFT